MELVPTQEQLTRICNNENTWKNFYIQQQHLQSSDDGHGGAAEYEWSAVEVNTLALFVVRLGPVW